MAPTANQLAKLAKQSRKMLSSYSVAMAERPAARSLKRRLTDCQRQEIMAKHDAGETLRALAKEYGLSESGLSEMLLTAKIEIRKTPITEEDADQAVSLYERGLSVRKIVVELRYPVGTIRRVLKERDVRMRIRGRS